MCLKHVDLPNGQLLLFRNLKTWRSTLLNLKQRKYIKPSLQEQVITVDYQHNTVYNDNCSAVPVDEEMIPATDTQWGSLDVFNDNIVIRTHEKSHKLYLTPIIVLLDVKAINGVILTKPPIPLWNDSSNGPLLKDTLLLHSCVPTAITKKHKRVLTQDIHECYQTILMEHIQLPKFGRAHSIQRVTFVFQSLALTTLHWEWISSTRSGCSSTLITILSNGWIKYQYEESSTRSGISASTTSKQRRPPPSFFTTTQSINIILRTALWKKNDKVPLAIKCYNDICCKLLRINVIDSNQLMMLIYNNWLNSQLQSVHKLGSKQHFVWKIIVFIKEAKNKASITHTNNSIRGFFCIPYIDQELNNTNPSSRIQHTIILNVVHDIKTISNQVEKQSVHYFLSININSAIILTNIKPRPREKMNLTNEQHYNLNPSKCISRILNEQNYLKMLNSNLVEHINHKQIINNNNFVKRINKHQNKTLATIK